VQASVFLLFHKIFGQNTLPNESFQLSLWVNIQYTDIYDEKIGSDSFSRCLPSSSFSFLSDILLITATEPPRYTQNTEQRKTLKTRKTVNTA